jgi:chromosome segregation ATPase
MNFMESRLISEVTGVRTQMNERFEDLKKGQEEIRKEQIQLRADMNAGLRKIERKMEILNDVLLNIQAQLRDHEYRLEALESKAPGDEAAT